MRSTQAKTISFKNKEVSLKPHPFLACLIQSKLPLLSLGRGATENTNSLYPPPSGILITCQSTIYTTVSTVSHTPLSKLHSQSNLTMRGAHKAWPAVLMLWLSHRSLLSYHQNYYLWSRLQRDYIQIWPQIHTYDQIYYNLAGSNLA